MRMTIKNNIKSTILKIDIAKKYLKLVKDISQSESVHKSLAETLMGMLTTMKFNGS